MNQVVYVSNSSAIRQVSINITRDPTTNEIASLALSDTTFILKNFQHSSFLVRAQHYLVIGCSNCLSNAG